MKSKQDLLTQHLPLSIGSYCRYIGKDRLEVGKLYKIIGYYFYNKFLNFDEKYGYVLSVPGVRNLYYTDSYDEYGQTLQDVGGIRNVFKHEVEHEFAYKAGPLTSLRYTNEKNKTDIKKTDYTEKLRENLLLPVGSKIKIKEYGCLGELTIIGYYFANSFLNFSSEYGYVTSREAGHSNYLGAYDQNGVKLTKSVGNICNVLFENAILLNPYISNTEAKVKPKYKIYKPIEIKLKSCKKSFHLLSRA